MNQHNFTYGAQINRSPFLSPMQLRDRVPSAFAENQAGGLSDRYAFCSTSRIIGDLDAQGFHPVKAIESRTRTEGHAGYQKHMIRFAHESADTMRVGEERFELVLVNSHCGSASLQLMGGVYRLVCSNGLIIGADSFRVRATHLIGDAYGSAQEAMVRVIESAPLAMRRVTGMKALPLHKDEAFAFAESARGLMENANVPSATQLLAPRRREDAGTDLWSTLNRVQENAIRGGLRTVDETGRPARRTRAVKGVDGDVRLNSALWSLAEKMAELKGADLAATG